MTYTHNSVVTIQKSTKKDTNKDFNFNDVNNKLNNINHNNNNINHNSNNSNSNSSPKEISNFKIYNKNDLDAKMELVWPRVIGFIVLHLAAFYGVHILVHEAPELVLLLTLLGMSSTIAVTAGAHRLWTHKSYKAKWQMRLLLMIFQSMAYQNCIWEWVRDHRAHHKFTDTNGDPHNSRRGFFFCHMGWLLVKKHPEVKEKGKQIDMSDIEQDQIVMFQKKYFYVVMPILCFILPACIPYYIWNYPFYQSFYICSILRYIITLHGTWFVNSAAHLWGFKPYDKSINPTDNRFVIAIGQGEGYHNYHHVFPWDYKAAEMGSYFFNSTKVFIDICAKIGWAYDLKTASEDMIRKRILRTGDGTHKISLEHKKIEDLIKQLNHKNEENLVWGWGDHDMDDEDRKDVIITNKLRTDN